MPWLEQIWVAAAQLRRDGQALAVEIAGVEKLCTIPGQQVQQPQRRHGRLSGGADERRVKLPSAVAELGKHHFIFHNVGSSGGTACGGQSGEIGERQSTYLLPLPKETTGRVFLCPRKEDKPHLRHQAGDAVAQNPVFIVQTVPLLRICRHFQPGMERQKMQKQLPTQCSTV